MVPPQGIYSLIRKVRLNHKEHKEELFLSFVLFVSFVVP